MINEKVDTYLEEINLTKIARDRLDKVYNSILVISPEDVNELFITETIAENGIRQYLNAWFFTNNFVIESKNFMFSDDIDILKIKGNIAYTEIKSSEFDYLESTDNSRLLINFRVIVPDSLGGEFVATGNNCIPLLQIYKDYIIKNLTNALD